MARLNIYNGNILISNDSPVSGQEFTVTVPLNNQETFPPGINSDAACNLDGSVTAGHGGILTLTISHEDQGEVKQQQEKVCLNQANLGPEERISFDCTVNEPGEVTSRNSPVRQRPTGFQKRIDHGTRTRRWG